jgi:hypothetical protein
MKPRNDSDKSGKKGSFDPESVPKGKADSDKSKEIGIPMSAPPHVKAADKKMDQVHKSKEGSPKDVAQDKAIMDVHRKSFAMGQKSAKSGLKGIKEY